MSTRVESRYFCHSCGIFITPSNFSNLFCPQCNETFIEEVNDDNESEFAMETDAPGTALQSRMDPAGSEYQDDLVAFVSALMPGISSAALRSVPGSTNSASSSSATQPTSSANTSGSHFVVSDNLDATEDGSNTSSTSGPEVDLSQQSYWGDQSQSGSGPSTGRRRFTRNASVPYSRVFDDDDGLNILSTPPPFIGGARSDGNFPFRGYLTEIS